MRVKEKSKLEPIFYRTSFFVIAYILLVGLAMLVQSLPLIVPSLFGLSLNINMNLPLEVLATSMIYICSGYLGVDRTAFALYSTQLEYGVSNVGNPSSLRNVIYATLFIFLEACILNVFYDVTLPLVSLATTLGTEVAIYVTGNKAIKLCGSVNGKLDTPVGADAYSQSELHELEVKESLKSDPLNTI